MQDEKLTDAYTCVWIYPVTVVYGIYWNRIQWYIYNGLEHSWWALSIYNGLAYHAWWAQSLYFIEADICIFHPSWYNKMTGPDQPRIRLMKDRTLSGPGSVHMKDRTLSGPGSVHIKDRTLSGPGSVHMKDHTLSGPGSVHMKDRTLSGPGSVHMKDRTLSGGYLIYYHINHLRWEVESVTIEGARTSNHE